jgi:hypothetical protein
VEDAKHVWICQGTGANEVWEKSMTSLHEWLLKQKTQQNIADIISDRLSAWRYDNAPNAIPSSFGIQTAVENQDKTGWQALLEWTPANG